jgi:uncharacterized phosphatase
MKTIYFVRHGESDANSRRIMAGTVMDVGLTSKGRTQAKKAGQDLKDKNIDLIVSSPMKRATETAEIIAKEIDYNPKKIIMNPLFIERDFGVYSKGPVDIFVDALDKDDLHESVEKVSVMEKRVTAGLSWLAGQKADRIVLVSHGDVSAVLRLIHQKLPHSHMYKLKDHGNAEIYEFTL